MDIRTLHEFLVLAQTENYLEAADLLFISQPTLTRHIKNLEDELGRPLFERTTRYVRLNKYGRLLVPFARQFTELNTQFINQFIAEEKSECKNSLSISTIPAMVYYGISSFLVEFQCQYPDCRFNIMPAYSESVMEKLRQRECEFGIIRERTPCKSDDKIVRLPFTTDRIIAIVNASHPLANHESVALSDLKNADIITLPRETLVCDIISNACLKAGFIPHIVMSDHNINHLFDCIRLGMGVGLLMDKHFNEYVNHPASLSGLKAIEVTPIYRTYIYLCYMKNYPLSENGRAFLDTYYQQFGSREDEDIFEDLNNTTN